MLSSAQQVKRAGEQAGKVATDLGDAGGARRTEGPRNLAAKIRGFVRKYPFRYAKMVSAPFEIRAYLKRHGKRYLNIGADGNKPRGWLNIDLHPTFGVVYLDATRMAPLPSESFDAVLCEHMIEHVSHRDGTEICKQIHRILKPGGVVRLVTPDLDRLARLVLELPTPDDERSLMLFRKWMADDPSATAVDAMNVAFRNYGHQYLYNRTALRSTLADLGFLNIVETSPNGHGHAIFRDVQGHVSSLMAHATGSTSDRSKSSMEEVAELEAFAFEAQR